MPGELCLWCCVSVSFLICDHGFVVVWETVAFLGDLD